MQRTGDLCCNLSGLVLDLECIGFDYKVNILLVLVNKELD